MSRITSSPHSSDEAASRHGSPETKLTAFSPEDARFKSRIDSAIGIGARNESMAYPSL